MVGRIVVARRDCLLLVFLSGTGIEGVAQVVARVPPNHLCVPWSGGWFVHSHKTGLSPRCEEIPEGGINFSIDKIILLHNG